MNEKNEWDMVETDAVEGPVKKVPCNEIVEAISLQVRNQERQLDHLK